MSKYNIGVEGETLKVGLDLNEDGQEVVTLKLSLKEAVQEAFTKGGKIEGVKVVDFRFELTQLVLKIDSDQDGETLAEIRIDLAEAIDEAGVLK